MSHENIKRHCHKKVILWFFNLGEENFLKVAAFVLFPTSVMVLFEIHQRVKGHVLKELCVSFNDGILESLHFDTNIKQNNEHV